MKNTPTHKKPPAPAQKKPPEKKVAQKGGGAVWPRLAVSIAVVAMGIGVVFYAQMKLPMAQSTASGAGDELTQMRARMGAMERQMQAQAGALAIRAEAPSSEIAAQFDAQQRTVTALEEKLEAMRRQQEGGASQARLSAMVLTLASLQQKVEEGAAFEGDVTTLQSLATLIYGQGQSGAVTTALSHLQAASGGVPSSDAVQTEFDTMVTQVMRHAAEVQKNAGWRGWLRAMLARFMTVRALDKKGEGVDATLARAEAELAAGRLAQVLTIVETLPPEAQAQTQAFKDVLNQRLLAQQAVLNLQRQLHDELQATLSDMVLEIKMPAPVPAAAPIPPGAPIPDPIGE